MNNLQAIKILIDFLDLFCMPKIVSAFDLIYLNSSIIH